LETKDDTISEVIRITSSFDSTEFGDVSGITSTCPALMRGDESANSFRTQ
jgi:hypothetical protein